MGLLPRIHYRVVGDYDFADEVALAPNGTVRTGGGTYVSRAPAERRLTRDERAALRAHLAALPPLDAPPPGVALGPPDADAPGFTAVLTLEDDRGATVLHWRGPEPPHPALHRLVRWLRLR
jgi:hypothetical protein